MSVDHHDHDKIVELIRVSTRFEADVLIAKLHENGINATGSYGDADGIMPHIALIDGHSVMVFDSDLARANAVISDTSE